MTLNDLLATIDALPNELQFALATSVLDRGARKANGRYLSSSRRNTCGASKRSSLIRTRGKHGMLCVRNFLEGERRQNQLKLFSC